MMGKRTFSILLLSSVLFLTGCGDDSVHPGTKIDGVWGARHIELVAASDETLLEYDCAHGTIDGALIPDPDGRFDLVGTHTRESGGPVNLNDPPDVHPARYRGRILGDRLTLTVTLTDTGDVLGPFVLARGVPGLLYKCL